MTEIEVKNLCKTINKNMVLDNINLHMVSGQVYGFQGINGSGKTMLMRALIGLIHPTDMINKEIDSLIEEVGLKSARNKKYKKYSLGMKQRLGIAAAVLGNPDIVVLDEPTNALDDDGKDMVKRIVKMQKERGALVIISCHEMQTLEELSDEIVRLKEGRICE